MRIPAFRMDDYTRNDIASVDRNAFRLQTKVVAMFDVEFTV